jgi:hypothetical protein
MRYLPGPLSRLRRRLAPAGRGSGWRTIAHFALLAIE